MKYLASWLDEMMMINPKGEWDPSPNQQARYFIQISAQTLFLVLSYTFHYFLTHVVGYSSKFNLL